MTGLLTSVCAVGNTASTGLQRLRRLQLQSSRQAQSSSAIGQAGAHTHRRNLEIAIIETQIFRLKDYELTCSAQASDNGRFEPSLVISKHIWPSRPRTIAVRRGAYATAQNAIESARAQGVEWVTNFGW